MKDVTLSIELKLYHPMPLLEEAGVMLPEWAVEGDLYGMNPYVCRREDGELVRYRLNWEQAVRAAYGLTGLPSDVREDIQFALAGGDVQRLEGPAGDALIQLAAFGSLEEYLPDEGPEESGAWRN